MCGRKCIPLCVLLLAGCRAAAPTASLAPVAEPPPTPAAPTLYTACGQIHSLTAASDRSLWAATAGGALRWRSADAMPARWTAADGLAGSDLHAVASDGAGAVAVTETRLCRLEEDGKATPEAGPTDEELRGLITDAQGTLWLATNHGIYARTDSANWRLRYVGEAWRMASDGTHPWAVMADGLRRLDDGKLFPLPAAPADLGTATALAAGPDGIILATALGLWRWDGRQWREMSLPPGSPASHVSALCLRAGELDAGLYGDGVYRLRGAVWQRLPNSPSQTREVTALAALPGGLAVGTRQDGVWGYGAAGWQPRSLPGALPSADIYGVAGYRGALWASTFDSGLLRMDRAGQTTVTQADGLRSASPRALVVFGDRLYVRHTTGQVDCTEDGLTWHPAFAPRDLPRCLISALATDGKRLYVGGWASWSAWDGQVWEHHDKDLALAGQVITAIAARPGEVWMGTQKQGVFVYANGRYTHLYEAQGLTDDWITCLSVTPARVLVGTYTGGLLAWDGARFAVILKPQIYAIRAVCLRPGDGRALAATPLGVYEEAPSGWHLLAPARCGGAETQALLPLPTGLWIGSRTGLAFLPEPLTAQKN